MANERFKVKFGLAVGDTAATIDAATGDIVTNGDIQLGGNDIRASDGNTNITLTSNTLTAFAGDIRVGGNDIQTSDGTTALTFANTTGNVTVAGDLQVSGNDIRASDGNTNITLTSNTLTTFAGDVRINGNDIQASNGSTNITLTSNTLTAFAGDIRVGGNDIQTQDGTVALTLTNTTGNVTVAGDLFVAGNEIFSSGGNRNLTFSGTNVTVEGDLTVGGNDIKASDGTTALTLTNVTGSVAVNGDLTVTGGDITTPITGTASVFNTNATAVNIAGAATTVSIGANTGTTTINNSLVADDISILTVDATNIEVTNIKAKDGAAAMTIADTTGAVTVSSSLTVDNIDIRGNTISSTNTNGAINLTPNGTGTVVIPTADITNLDVTNIRALDGTAAATVANSTGIITVSTELNVDNLNISGNTISSTNTNGAINLTPNGTGTVVIPTADITNLDVTNIRALDGTAAIVISNTTGAVTVSTDLTVDNLNISGNNVSSTNTNGNITLTPNGTGDIAVTVVDGGNLTNTRNYVFGAIRNATTEALGDIWALNTTGTVQPMRGVSLDNSADTTKVSGVVARSYGDVNTNRSRLVFERSRGTAASPIAVQMSDFLGEVAATGYTSTGWFNDTRSAVPGFFGFTAAENWVSNTNVGTAFSLSLAPTATTITAGTSLTQVMAVNPQGAALRSDAMVLCRGKTSSFSALNCSTSGTTLTIGTVTGTIAVGQAINTATTPALVGLYIVRNISGSGAGSTWELSGSPGTLTALSIQGATGYLGGAGGTTVDALADLRLIRNTIQGSTGTTQIVTSAAGATLELRGNNIQLENAAGTAIVGSSVTYNRVYGQWQHDATITPAAANTAYAVPFQGVNSVIDFANIATASNTSEIRPNALGMYKLQFSAQVQNSDNQDHTITFWWRKNGTDISNSAGYFTVPKANVASGALIVGWDNIVEVTTITDYYQLMYAVSDTTVTMPFIAAAAPRPGAAAVFLTLVPIGA